MSTKKEMWPVMLTPFTERGEVDYDGLEKLIEFYEEGGLRTACSPPASPAKSFI